MDEMPRHGKDLAEWHRPVVFLSSGGGGENERKKRFEESIYSIWEQDKTPMSNLEHPHHGKV